MLAAMPDDVKILLAGLEAGRDTLLARWREELLRRSWSLRRMHACAAPDAGGRPSFELLQERCGLFLEALAQGLRGAHALEIGAPEYREPVQILSFTAGWMAGSGMTVTDALALVHSLQEVLPAPREFFQALALVVSEAHCAALSQNAQARYRDAMEKSQLVCTLHPSLPCLFLVGDPDLQALDDAMGRLMMLVVMREAPALIVDGSGLFHPERVLRDVLSLLSKRSAELPAQVCVSGLTPEMLRELRGVTSARVSMHETMQGALAVAAERCGLSWPHE